VAGAGDGSVAYSVANTPPPARTTLAPSPNAARTDAYSSTAPRTNGPTAAPNYQETDQRDATRDRVELLARLDERRDARRDPEAVGDA